MRSRIVAAVLSGALALVAATSASAQGDAPPNREPADQAAPTDQLTAIGACGSQATTVVDRSTVGLAPIDQGNKDATGASELNLMSVRGTIVHAEGNLMLVKLSDSLASGNTQPTAGGLSNALAVVRLPAECPPGILPDGGGVLAVGTPRPNGILDAQSIQPAD